MQSALLLAFGGLTVYALLPSRWKKIFWVNLAILLPTASIILWSQLSSGYTWQQLGIRTDNLGASLALMSWFVAVAAVIMALVAMAKNRFTWTWNMTVSVILYPLWGYAQQFLILSFINVRLMELHWPVVVIALLTGFAFMLLHVPDKWLMPATFGLGFYFSLLFQEQPNILTLGIAHGWLGVLYYYWVIGKDPLAEKFGRKID